MKTKIAISLIFFVISGWIFSAYTKSAKALTSVDALYLFTHDTTPLLVGSVDEAGSSVTVTIEGHAYAATVEDTLWILQINSAMDYGIYDLELSAEKGATTVTDTIADGLVIDQDFPFEIYTSASLLENDLESVTFIIGQTYTLNEITVTIPDNTSITRTGGGNYDLSEMIGNSVASENDLIAKQIRFGLPNVDLTFSNALTLEVEVDTSYNGQRLNIFSRSDDGEWDPLETSCVVSGGTCTFEILHATYFAMSPYDSIANNDSSYEEPDVDKIEAKKYFSPLGGKWKVELVIKGDKYNDDTEITLGNRDAYKTKYKNKHRIIARFSLDKLLRSGQDEFIVRVTNGEETEKFEKKLKISELTMDYQGL